MTKDELLIQLRTARGHLEDIPLLTEQTEVEVLAEADDAIDRAMAILKDVIDKIRKETE